MYITKLEKYQSKKILVYIDDEFAFFMYPSELRKYQIEENVFLSEDDYRLILSETILKRGKQKALSLLERMDRTELELRRKLKQILYTDTQVDEIIAYVKSYHYIDDRRYTEYYIRNYIGKKSIRMIMETLRQKGISSDLIQAEMEKQEVDEKEALCNLIRKKCKNINNMSYEEKQKLRSFLYRKGFSMDLIIKYVP